MKELLNAIDNRMKRIDRNLRSAPESAHEFLKGDRVFLSVLKTLIERRASELSENKSEKIPERRKETLKELLNELKEIDVRINTVERELKTAVGEEEHILNARRTSLVLVRRFLEKQIDEFHENKSEKIPEPAHTGGCLSDWKCAMCGKANPAFTSVCEHCGAYRFTDARPPASTPEPQKSEGAYVIPFDGKSLPPMYGWICPVCGRGNSPTSDRCGCKDEPTNSFFDSAMAPVKIAAEWSPVTNA